MGVRRSRLSPVWMLHLLLPDDVGHKLTLAHTKAPILGERVRATTRDAGISSLSI